MYSYMVGPEVTSVEGKGRAERLSLGERALAIAKPSFHFWIAPGFSGSTCSVLLRHLQQGQTAFNRDILQIPLWLVGTHIDWILG